jgi:hypothetical protein
VRSLPSLKKVADGDALSKHNSLSGRGRTLGNKAKPGGLRSRDDAPDDGGGEPTDGDDELEDDGGEESDSDNDEQDDDDDGSDDGSRSPGAKCEASESGEVKPGTLVKVCEQAAAVISGSHSDPLQVIHGTHTGRTGQVIGTKLRGWFEVIFEFSAKVYNIRKNNCIIKSIAAPMQPASPPCTTPRRIAALSSSKNILKSEPQACKVAHPTRGNAAINSAVHAGRRSLEQFSLFQPIDAMDIEDTW